MEAGCVRRSYTMGYGTVERSGFTAREGSASLTAAVLTLPQGVSLCRGSGLYARPPTHSGRSTGAQRSGCTLQAGYRVLRGSPGLRPGVFNAIPTNW
jgi:hypothetical protein